MRYIEFKDSISSELRRNPSGLTWMELKERLSLPYDRPCQSWIERMEEEPGLLRVKGKSRSLVWKVKNQVVKKRS